MIYVVGAIFLFGAYALGATITGSVWGGLALVAVLAVFSGRIGRRIGRHIADTGEEARIGTLAAALGGRLPEWAERLPPNLDLSAEEIRRLESLRQRAGDSHDGFVLHILSHSETTRRILRRQYELITAGRPESSLDERMAVLLLSRARLATMTGGDLWGLGSVSDTQLALGMSATIAGTYRTPDALIDAIVAEEDRHEAFKVPAGKEALVAEVAAVLQTAGSPAHPAAQS